MLAAVIQSGAILYTSEGLDNHRIHNKVLLRGVMLILGIHLGNGFKESSQFSLVQSFRLRVFSSGGYLTIGPLSSACSRSFEPVSRRTAKHTLANNHSHASSFCSRSSVQDRPIFEEPIYDVWEIIQPALLGQPYEWKLAS